MEKYIQQNDKIIKSLADSIDRLSMETFNYFRNLEPLPKVLWNSETDKTKLDNSKIKLLEIKREVLKEEIQITAVFSSSRNNVEALPYYLKGFVSRLLIEKYL